MSRYNVKVIPRAKHNAIVERNGELVVRVTAPADDGKANEAVISVLARHWKVPTSRVSILRGVRSRHKLVEKLDPRTNSTG